MKKYEYARGESAAFTLKVGDRNISITFAGGRNRPFRVKPYLKTADKEIQKAIEGMASFGSEVTEVKTAKVPVIPAKMADPAKDGLLDDKSNPDGEVGPVQLGDGVSYPEIVLVQAAREILVSNHEQKASDLPNKAAILAKAAELQVLFPNLPE